MFERLKNILTSKSDDEDNQSSKVDTLISELDLGIQEANSSISEAKANEVELKKNISILFSEHQNHKTKAKGLLAINRKPEAEKVYKKVQLLEQQLNQYGKILTDVETTIHELETQKAHFELKKDEINSKKLIYEVKIKGAQNKADIDSNLLSTLNSDEFTDYEDLLQDAHAKAEAIAEINEDFSSYRTEKENTIDDLKEEINKEQQEREEQAFKAQKGKIDALFNRMKTSSSNQKIVSTNKYEEERKKEQSINAFFSKEQVKKVDTKVSEFFKDKPSTDKLKDFFKD